MRFRRCADESGVALVLVALVMVAVLGVAAIVVDLGYGRQVAREAQSSADAAALAGARDLPAPTDTNQAAKQMVARDAALRYAAVNLLGTSTAAPSACGAGEVPACTRTVDDVTVVATTPYNGILNLIEVRICEPNPTFFAGVIDQSNPTVCRRAVGRRTSGVGQYDYGLISLHPNRCPGLLVGGTGETNVSLTASVMVNSSCPTGAMVDNGSSWEMTAGFFGVVGAEGVACDADSSKQCIDREIFQVPSFPDPIKSVYPTEPAVPALSPTAACSAGVWQPGRYPNNCQVTGNNTNVQLQSGIYYFDNGFEFQGGSLTCAAPCTNGVMLFVKGGLLKLNGNSAMNLPGYSASPYNALPMAVWISSTNTNDHIINGTNGSVIGGTIYAPGVTAANKFTLEITGSGNVTVNGLVAASTIKMQGSMNLTVNVPTNAPEVPPDDEVILEQ